MTFMYGRNVLKITMFKLWTRITMSDYLMICKYMGVGDFYSGESETLIIV